MDDNTAQRKLQVVQLERALMFVIKCIVAFVWPNASYLAQSLEALPVKISN